jgi:hypothetical protein
MLHLTLWKKLKRIIMRRSIAMMSVSQLEEARREVMGPQACECGNARFFESYLGRISFFDKFIAAEAKI